MDAKYKGFTVPVFPPQQRDINGNLSFVHIVLMLHLNTDNGYNFDTESIIVYDSDICA